MPSRKEEREQLRRLREEKEADQRSGERKRLIAAYIGAGLLVLAIGAGAVMAMSGGGNGGGGNAHVSLQSGQTNGVPLDERDGTPPPPMNEDKLTVAARKAGCQVRDKLPEEGRSHLPENAQTPKYRTRPPTSGNHVAPPFQQADGAYSETPDQINVVHSLEHGRIVLQYQSSLTEAEQLQLRGLYDSAYSAALLFPNDEMPYEVAVASWGELLGCSTYQGAATLDAIRTFGAEYQGTSPEPLQAFGPLTGPSFASAAS